MADKYALGGAAIGGVAGGVLGGPAGAMMGAGAGGALGGMLSPRQKYKSNNFSDIDLARDNPALYAELQKYEQLGNQLEAQYNQRRTGPTASEMRMREESLGNQRSNLQSRGALGGSTSLLAEQDLNARFQDEVMQRAFQEQQQLMQARLAQRAQQAQMFANAQQGIMGNLNQGSMLDYQSRQAEDAARNQFFTGLMSGGAGMYGAGMQADAMGKNTAMLKQQNQNYMGIPGGYSPAQQQMMAPQPLYAPQQTMVPAYQGPSYGGYV